ncbi:hypothetical protein [Stratiformator vulcanicus]|uniref:hypothetical protein n=1 Tax=Stratiformator vulcanicus TaxID=2527980 RepID=UPI002877BB83|nr:hypothetical protein [Stratiformator vulcanicus]
MFLAGMLVAEGSNTAAAKHYTESFDDPNTTTLTAEHHESDVRLLAHRRNDRVFREGKAAEQFQFATTRIGSIVQLKQALPPARRLDELSASVLVRSNVPGVTANLRLVFPHQIDPSTGKNLTALISGNRYVRPGQWERLTSRTDQKALRDELRRIRYRLGVSKIDQRDLYVDQLVISAAAGGPTLEILVDELNFGPIVESKAKSAIEQVAYESDVEIDAPVEFRLGRFRVEQKPFFPRMAPYRGEDPAAFADAGFNVAWISDYRDTELIKRLAAHGVWCSATPPRALDTEGNVLAARSADLVPFTVDTKRILFWNLGRRIPATALDGLADWRKQIRQADRAYNRPLLGDVTDGEHVYSRYLEMLGASRTSTNTTFGYRDYRDWLEEKRLIARPGTYFWSWVPTEPAYGLSSRREAAGLDPVIVEPEQIRLQVYSAINAGCRAVGYWTSGPIDRNDNVSLERRLALSAINTELSLVDDLLAEAVAVGEVPFYVDLRKAGSSGYRIRSSNTPLRPEDDFSPFAKKSTDAGARQAAMYRTGGGLLILPVWFGRDAQLCPGQLAASDVSLIVPGVNDSASAWEITPTRMRSLKRERVPGGTRLTIPRFDQTAIILITSDRTLIAKLRERISEISRRAAETEVKLAELKLERVRKTNAALAEYNARQSDGPQLLARSESTAMQARQALQRGDYDFAAVSAKSVRQYLRILQRAHWDDAVRPMSTPLSSPHTAAFSTLPDHWRLLASLGLSVSPPIENSNSLLTGDFESIDAMLTAGWKHEQNRLEGVRTMAELVPDAKSGEHALRLLAAPQVKSETPRSINESPVTIESPPVDVEPGQIIHISGWIKIERPIVSNLDGLTIHDSLNGPSGALRWKSTGGWTRFEMLREASSYEVLTVTFALNGLGEAIIDDIRIIAHRPGTLTATKPEETRSAPVRFLDRLPGINRLTGRRGDSDKSGNGSERR